MLRRYMHSTEEEKCGTDFHRRARTYLVLASALLCTTLALMLVLQLVGQAGDTPWPGPGVVIQLMFVHVL